MISVIIPTFRPPLSRLIDLKKKINNLCPRFFEVVIVLSASKVPVNEVNTIFSELTHVSIIGFDDQKSAAENRNIGVRHASHEFLVFWDDDDDIIYFDIQSLKALKPGNYLLTDTKPYTISELITNNKLHHSNFLFHRNFICHWDEKNYPGEDWRFSFECLNLNYSGSCYSCNFSYNYKPKIYKTRNEHCYNFILSKNDGLTRQAISKLEASIKKSELESKIFDRLPSVLLAKLCAKIIYYIS